MNVAIPRLRPNGFALRAHLAKPVVDFAMFPLIALLIALRVLYSECRQQCKRLNTRRTA